MLGQCIASVHSVHYSSKAWGRLAFLKEIIQQRRIKLIKNVYFKSILFFWTF